MRLRWCGLALLLAGCLRLAGYHPRCAEDGDCPGGGVCEARICVEACIESPDSCPVGQSCRQGHCEGQEGCGSDGQCGAGKICTHGQCVAGCRHTTDCNGTPGMGCVDSICQPAKLCQQPSECSYPQMCLDNVCLNRPCGGSNQACPGDLKCQGGQCVLPAPASSGSDCGGPGQHCCPSFRCTNGCCAMVSSGTFACVVERSSCGTLEPGLCELSNGACGACGALGQPCCFGGIGDRWCSAADTACEPASAICRPCGREGQPCCGVRSTPFAAPDLSNGCTGAGLTCRLATGTQFTCQK